MAHIVFPWETELTAFAVDWELWAFRVHVPTDVLPRWHTFVTVLAESVTEHMFLEFFISKVVLVTNLTLESDLR